MNLELAKKEENTKSKKLAKKVENSLNRIRCSGLNAFISINDRAIGEAKEISANDSSNSLYGMTFAIKDNIMVKDMPATCASKMLEHFIAPYDATAVKLLKQNGAIILGKNNMDEFGMGSSNEYSYFGPCKNPIAESYVPGGSSGGSAASVAAGLVDITLGSDTAGSVRQPAALCGICGFKPSYGRISRYGLTAFASSLDQIGIMAKTPEEIIEIFSILDTVDRNDATMIEFPKDKAKIQNPKIAVLSNSFDEYVNKNIQSMMRDKIADLKKNGIIVDIINFSHFDRLLPIYHIISTAEASSNLARFDGIRYGYRSKNALDIEKLYIKNRSEGFGDEVKRRIMLGTFVLSKNAKKQYYINALRARRFIKLKVLKIFKKYDFIINPTTAELFFEFGKKDPIQMYNSDRFTVMANLVDSPAISMPIKRLGKLGVSLHIMSKPGNDYGLLDFAKTLI
ncbi:MAG: Asp-tRNA(Asn)/Glu-tRNA(Gln) amidotransferase subunit GatA [Candidatus Zixiibacteriota bacterium]